MLPKLTKLTGVNSSQRKTRLFVTSIMLCSMVMLTLLCPAFAATAYKATVSGLLNSMIEIIGTIFVAVGVILAVYAVGMLIMAFKNEDADSKSRASTLLVVAIILIAFPSIINTLNLTANIK